MSQLPPMTSLSVRESFFRRYLTLIILATGSQDKTVKLWKWEKGTSLIQHVATLAGHKRSIWSVTFSPVDQVIASASADMTVRVWNVNTRECIRTLEGHQSSVLRVSFLSRGLQLLSAGSDGLLKVWTLRTAECAASVEGHSDKTWALAISRDEQTIVTGGADSTIIVWRDNTADVQREAREKSDSQILMYDSLLIRALLM